MFLSVSKAHGCFNQEPLLEEYSVAAHVSRKIRFSALELVTDPYIDLQTPTKLSG